MDRSNTILLGFAGRIRGRIGVAPVIATFILFLMLVVAIFPQLIAPKDPLAGSLSRQYMPPFWMNGGSFEYPLGTDFIGRDVLSRLVFGTRVSLVVALLAVSFAGIVGTTMGVLSAYYGGWVDQVIMRLTDAFLALPGLVIAIFMAAAFGAGLQNVIIILGIVFWSQFARVIRSEVLSLKQKDFVRLAKVAGCTDRTIIMRHIVPNILNTIVVLANVIAGIVVIAEASMSFLGLGVPPPNPSWGSMLAEAKDGLFTGFAWLVAFPALAIMALVLSVNIIGDWLRIRLDPRLRQF